MSILLEESVANEFKKRFKVGGYVKHFKRETINTYKSPLEYLYEILGVAISSEMDQVSVIYKSLYDVGRIWSRPVEEFIAEVDHDKYPGIKQKYRFESIDEDAIIYNLGNFTISYLQENKINGVNVSNEFGKKPQVITICGSTKFKYDIIQAKRKLTLEGKIVLDCPFFQHTDGESFGKAEIAKLTELHLRKIDMSDAIYVVNKDGYIGEGTKAEIYYALFKKKEIIFMEEVNLNEVLLPCRS